VLVVKRYVDTLDLVAADGTWQRRLLDCPHGCDNPQWLPDGERISFQGWDGDVWILTVADGSMERFALPEGTWVQVDWSRDGRVAWLEVDRATRAPRLGVARVDGTDRRVIPIPREAGFPQFSPSGRYVGWHEGDNRDVYVYDTAGDGPPVVIRSPDSPVYDFAWDAQDRLVLSGNTVWAFDDALGRVGGRRVDPLGYAVDTSADGARTVWSRRPVGGFGGPGIVEVVTPDPGSVTTILWDDGARALEAPEWSPTGTHLAVWAIDLCECTWPF
jgi:Tol biopolymer transport system component